MLSLRARSGISDAYPAWVFLGATLEIILDVLGSTTNPEVFILQEDPKEVSRILKGLKGRLQRAPEIYTHWDSMVAQGGITKAHQGFLYCDGIQFPPDDFLALPGNLKVQSLLGRFDEASIDPIKLHRLSRKLSNHFSWWDIHSNAPLTGHGHEGPEVSIVVPVFGVENYLAQCLSSLSQQTHDDFEILVVNDGSRDRSGEIADQWALLDSRIHVHHQENAGCAAARMEGLRQSTGYFVGFVDGDDWVDGDMLRTLVSTAIRWDAEIAQCGFSRHYESTGNEEEEVEPFVFVRDDNTGAGLIREPLQLALRQPTIWRRIYQRSFLERHGIEFDPRIPRFDDLPFQFKTLSLVERLAVAPGAYYRYRQQRPGQDIQLRDERLYVHFEIFDGLGPFVAEHVSPQVKYAFFKVQLASHHWAFSLIDSSLKEQYALAARYDFVRHSGGVGGAFSHAFLAFTLGLRRGLWFLWLFTLRGASETAWNQARFYRG